MKKYFPYLTCVLGLYLTVVCIMQTMRYLNTGSTLNVLLSLVGLFLLIYTMIKTKVFTQLPFKNKK